MAADTLINTLRTLRLALRTLRLNKYPNSQITFFPNFLLSLLHAVFPNIRTRLY
jgi:hypothetical protein